MKAWHSSFVVKTAAYVLCLASMYAVLCGLSEGFSNYILRFWGIEINGLGFFASLVTGAVFFVVLIFAVWRSKPASEYSLTSKLHQIDYFLFIVISSCIIFLSYYFVLYIRNQYSIIISPLIAFTAGMALFVTTIIRIRDKSLRKTLYWLDFFGIYPVNNPTGLFMAVLLAGNLLSLLLSVSNYRYRIEVNLFSYVLSVFTLCALTYFCTFLKSLAISYEKANEEKIKSERFKTELIANVSHDIRTPLTSIINYVDLIKRLNIENVSLHEYISILDKKSNRLKILINDLMEASKVGTGNIAIDIKEIDLSELVGQIAGEFDAAFSSGHLTFIYNQPGEAIAVLADGRHLWRVMENIFSNAVKYAMPETRIYADIKRDEKTVVFSLKNISKEPLGISSDELMERFVRGDHARSTEGSGLGLYIAKSLTDLLGGQFEIVISGDLFEILVKLKAT